MVKIFVQVAGGGKTTAKKNAVYTFTVLKLRMK
jgi:hypothetical protein